MQRSQESRQPRIIIDHTTHRAYRQYCPSPDKIRTPASLKECVKAKVLVHGLRSVGNDQRSALRLTTFSNWEFSDDQLVLFLRQMFVDLELAKKFSIDLKVMDAFLIEVYGHYNQVAFHNFKHAFMVAQMVYAMIWMNELWNHFSDIELLSLLVASICYDLDHPGLSNYYQRSANTILAERFSQQKTSLLEHHHAETAFKILSQPKFDILAKLPVDAAIKANKQILQLILSSDSARSDIIEAFASCVKSFKFSNQDHRDLMLSSLIKLCGYNYQLRPIEISERWVERLLFEQFQEAKIEREMGIRVPAWFDPEQVRKAEREWKTISSVTKPILLLLGQILPRILEVLGQVLERQLEYYADMGGVGDY